MELHPYSTFLIIYLILAHYLFQSTFKNFISPLSKIVDTFIKTILLVI